MREISLVRLYAVGILDRPICTLRHNPENAIPRSRDYKCLNPADFGIERLINLVLQSLPIGKMEFTGGGRKLLTWSRTRELPASTRPANFTTPPPISTPAANGKTPLRRSPRCRRRKTLSVSWKRESDAWNASSRIWTVFRRRRNCCWNREAVRRGRAAAAAAGQWPICGRECSCHARWTRTHRESAK